MKISRGDKVLKSVDELGKPMESMKGIVLNCISKNEMTTGRIEVMWITKTWCGYPLISWVLPEHLTKIRNKK